VASWDRIKD